MALLQLVSKFYQKVDFQDVLSKASGHINRSFNSFQGFKSVDVVKFGIVSQLEGTTDSLKLRSGEVGELGVTVESERLANVCQDWEFDRLEGVVDTSKSFVDSFKLGERSG